MRKQLPRPALSGSLSLSPALLAAALLSAAAWADSIVIPAWSFARGNVKVLADPTKYADAGPVVASGMRKPWGWTVQYDVDVPVSSDYLLRICYAAGEIRPVDVFFDSQNIGRCCVTVSLASQEDPAHVTWKSSGSKWECVQNQWGKPVRLKVTAGRHTVKLARAKPLPHLVALRLDTKATFPPHWRPPRYRLRHEEAVPAAHRKAFARPSGFDTAWLRWEIENTMKTFGPRYPQGRAHLKTLTELETQLAASGDDSSHQKRIEEALMELRREATALWTPFQEGKRPAASFTIPAWTFDRGNARIYASPDEYADSGPLIGGGPQSPDQGVVQYDIQFPVTGEYTLQIRYSAAEARPVAVLLDGRLLGTCCLGVAFGTAPFEHPVLFTWRSSWARWEAMVRWNEPLKVHITAGKHTLTLSRVGPLPHLVALRFDSFAPFPKDWKAPKRKVVHIERVPPRQRAAFLPPDSVNVAALRAAVQDTMKQYGASYPKGREYLKRLSQLEKQQQACENGPSEEKEAIEKALKKLRQEAMLAHPALHFERLLFVKRYPFSAHIYEPHRASEVGGSLCMLSPVRPDGDVIELVPELSGGRFGRFDLSFDARKLVFAYKRKEKDPFRIYEIELDPATGRMIPGSLRQLTFDETALAQGACLSDPKGSETCRRFHDIDPCYLPNGNIIFASSRSMRNVFCFPATVTTLYLMDGDGRNARCLSPGPLNEMNPCVLHDGRIAYTRWEYVDKGLGNGQSLWTIRPDGSYVDHLFKNTSVRPAGMLYPRSVPGTQWVVTVGAPHCGREGGPVILIDTCRRRRTADAITYLTPEVGSPGMYQATWDMGFFKDPYPLAKDFFLVSYSPGGMRRNKAGYGIYVLDAWGNRAELYRDPGISCFQPVPLRPRPKPMSIPPAAFSEGAVESRKHTTQRTGTLLIQNVYQGLSGIERGRVAYVRVMGVLPWPWDENGMFRVGLNVGVHRKKVWGIVKVHKDGSALFSVPAEENVFFQVLDENFMALQHMPTFIYLMPGEYRSCVGCHERDHSTPTSRAGMPLALKFPPQRLMPQPGEAGPRMVDYAADVQPILDRRCVRCHSGNEPEAHLDLTGIPTADFCRSYENLIGKGLVSYRDCRYGRSGFRSLPPLSFGSPLSVLVERIRTAPCSTDLTQEEFIRIVTWIDANAPYYGTYRGKRSLEDKDDPDFRALPLAQK